MKKYFFLVVVILWVTTSFGQLYNNGAVLYINDKNSTSIASLRVNGDVTNNDGNFTNSVGLIEVTGNWTNTISSNNYNSTGIERFIGTANQLISGTWNGTSGNNNQFYNLYVNKSSGYVSLGQNTHVNSSGSIQFESTGGIIRTATASSSNTGDYAYYVYLQNPATASLSGYSWPSGTTRYIEGKLKRQVSSASTYQFPIGFQPSDKDGMEAYQIKFNSAPTSTGILSYIRPATVNVLYQNVLCDVGRDPGAGAQQFPACAGGKDGIYDLYYLDLNLSHEWMATPDNNTSYNYDITFYPGSNLDNLSYYTIPGACDASYTGKRIRVYTKDGVVGGSQQIGPGNWAPFRHLTTYIWCDFDNNTLSSQTSFSAFRIFGTSDASYTALPVELVSFTGSNVGEYNRLDWTTASEQNTSKFIVEKSIDGRNWVYLGERTAAGNSSVQLTYSFNDYSPTQGNNYYRLKMIDLDQTFDYSNILNIPVNGTLVNAIVAVYPNPVSNQLNVDIQSTQNVETEIKIYNVIGEIAMNKTFVLTKGINKLQLNSSNLPQGSYILEFTDAVGKTHTQKFIKQ